MRRTAIGWGMLMGLLAPLFGQGRAPGGVYEIGERPPALELVDTEGRRRVLDPRGGVPVLLFHFASW